MKHGIVRNGRRIRLAHVRLGRRIATTQADIEKFTRELAEADSAPATAELRADIHTTGKRTEEERQAAIERASARLSAAGV